MAKKIFIENTVTGERVDAATEEGHQILLKDLREARDYSYEAMMSDYSMASINRAKVELDEAKQNLIDAGYEVPEW